MARAILLGFVVNTIGVGAWVLCLILIPGPWPMVVMAGLLWLYWKYFSGSWWPQATTETRRTSFRAVALPAPIWKWGLVAAMLFVVAVQSGLVVTFRVIEFPAELFKAEYNLDAVSLWMAWPFIIMASLVAGICEETGFRGYMQEPLERRYGPVAGITIVSVVFVVTHLHQAWAMPILAQIFLVGVMLGSLTFAAGSLIPAMIAHTTLDVFNFSYWWSDVAGEFQARPIAETGLDAHAVTWTLVFGVSLVFFFAVVYRLRCVSRELRGNRDHRGTPGSLRVQ